MENTSKLCVLTFDEISIKEGLAYQPDTDEVEGFENLGSVGRTKFVANHALVFMLRGISANWKQPLGYFLCSGTIKASVQRSLLFECLDKVKEAGLDVCVLICDQGANNQSMFNNLKITVDNHFIMHQSKKIYVMYDPPHLIKSVRNNLKNAGFLVEGDEILWEHIEAFYALDSQLPIRMAPKLTKKHVELKAFTAMRVKLATQILSHSVAAGIATMCHLNILTPSAQSTAAFVEKMDKLFNASTSLSKTPAETDLSFSSWESSMVICYSFPTQHHDAHGLLWGLR